MRRSPELEQGTQQWLDWRAKGVGGSEVAAILGESRYDDPLSVWKKKTDAAKGVPVDGGYENVHMRRGKALEPIARAKYEGLMGWKSPPLCVLHDEYDFVRASLDGLREPQDDVVLEIKAPGDTNHEKSLRVQREPSLFRQLIPHYYCQIQYQLLITGSPVAHYLSYNESPRFGCDSFCLVEVPADAEYQRRVLDAVVAFWDCVVREEPPPGP